MAGAATARAAHECVTNGTSAIIAAAPRNIGLRAIEAEEGAAFLALPTAIGVVGWRPSGTRPGWAGGVRWAPDACCGP